MTDIPNKFKKIHPTGYIWELQHIDLEKGRKFLEDHGFVQKKGETRVYNNSQLHAYVNPHTGQRANLSDKGPGKSHVSFFTTQKIRRRTREQIRSANFVLYD